MTTAGEWAVIRRRAGGLEGTEEQQERARARIENRRTYARTHKIDSTPGEIRIIKAIREVALGVIAGRPRPQKCEICAETNQYAGPLHFDHCHATGAFRGWLCVRCNHTLGKVKDDAALLRKLAAYVENPIGPTRTPNEEKSE